MADSNKPNMDDLGDRVAPRKVCMFKVRRNGRIPAIALGRESRIVSPIEDEEEEEELEMCTIIEGLGFEEVYPDPHVHPIKLAEEFDGVIWRGQYNVAERDDLPLAGALDDEDGALNIIKESANVITSVYTNVWNTFRNYKLDAEEDEDQYLHMAMHRFRHDDFSKLRRRMEQHGNLPDFNPKNQQLGEELLVCFLSSFGFHQDIAMLSFLKASIPNLKGLVCATVPAETADKTLSQGLPHCLVYGTCRSYNWEHPGRGRARYRDIQVERSNDGSWLQSRSCSPDGEESFDSDDTCIKRRGDPVEGAAFHSKIAVQRNLEEAVIAVRPLVSRYLEPHKPCIICMDPIPDLGIEIKLVVDITSVLRWHGEGGRYVLEKIINESARQCVWSCLASLQEGQTEIMGLCCCIEGFKLLKIVKNDGHFRISETDLVLFRDYDRVVRLLSTINAAL